ncbi:MAG: hypothetical protein ACLQA5_21075 [Solirubrobacteraceae bacterium]
MALLEHDSEAVLHGSAFAPDRDELAARRSLRVQIDKLERELSDAFVTAYPMGGLDEPPTRSWSAPRLLGLGELERVRDDLAARVQAARGSIARRADQQAERRVALEKMLLDPGRYRFVRIANREIGEPGCGVWYVKPRLGLIGMLMGWWEVKLSSGCPLAPAAGASDERRGFE